MAVIAVTLPNDGETADAADLSNPINTIVDLLNGNLDADNLKPNSITTSKIVNEAVTLPKLALTGSTNEVTGAEVRNSDTYGDLATTQAVTVTVGSSGLLLVAWGCKMSSSQNSAGGSMSFELSGANTSTASDNRAAGYVGSTTNDQDWAGKTILLTGLNAGSTIVTAKFRKTGVASTCTFSGRGLSALPL